MSTSLVNGHDLLEWMGVLSGGVCGGVVQPKIPGQQLCDPVDGVVSDALQPLTQGGLGIEVVPFGRREQAIEGCGSFSAGVGTREPVMLATHRDRAQGPLGRRVVDLEAALSAVAREGVATGEGLVDRRRGIGLRGEFRQRCFQPRTHRVEQGPRRRVANFAALAGRPPADFLLHRIQGADALDRFGRNR